MGKSKLAGCCNRVNKKAFQGREILAFNGGSVLCVHTDSLRSLPTLPAQGVATHSPTQHYQVQGQPQYVQGGQPVYAQQGQPMPQGQLQHVPQGQPMYVEQSQMQQGHPPQYVHPGVQGQPPLVSAVVVSPLIGTASQDKQPAPQKYVEEDPPTELPPPSSPPMIPQVPVPPIASSRQGQYVISDPSVLGSTVAIKTPEGAVVHVAIPAGSTVGAIVTYTY